MWNHIWQADVPPKVHIFVWMVAADNLATQKNKRRRTLECTNCCQICGNDSEDALLATVVCSRAVALRQPMRSHWHLPNEASFRYSGPELDLMNMFGSFQKGELPLFHLNYGNIILLPKKENAIQIQQYRPICLLNVSFKIFTKVGTNRVMEVAHKVIRPTQSAFMPGSHILEGVLVLHETVHELQRKKMDGVLLKIDFEKAYDKVQWPFLQQVLRMKGFNQKWCSWIENFVTRGSVGIKVNDDLGHYFQTKKGLRQGDPLSPILFNIVADMLAILISRAKDDGQVDGLIPHLVEGGVSILQYADDTILFLSHDLEKALNLKLILCMFEQLSGLKINFHKSELFCFGQAKDVEDQYRGIFGCESG